MPYVIKSKNKKFLQKDEDNTCLIFNLVSDQSTASKFSTKEEAEEVRKFAVDNAVSELNYLSSLRWDENALYSEMDSIESQFITLTISELK